MTAQELDKLRYPIGKFQRLENITPEIIAGYISTIETFPARMKKVVENLTPEQLDTPYRPGGWTVRQVVHHCGDSHMNAFIRQKITLTEETPTIKTYFEDRWAELADARQMPIEPGLKLLEGLHQRWTVLLKSLSQQDMEKKFFHPEQKKEIRLIDNIALYSWHCNHHLAHANGAYFV